MYAIQLIGKEKKKKTVIYNTGYREKDMYTIRCYLQYSVSALS
jgi:hypothetical protein